MENKNILRLNLCGYSSFSAKTISYSEFSHSHPCWQMDFCIDGESKVRFTDYSSEFHKHEILITPPSVEHCIVYPCDKSFSCLSFKFDYYLSNKQIMQPVLINSVETLEFRKKMISLFFNAFFSFFPIELAESSREFSINKAIPGVKFIEKLLEGVLEEFPLDALSKKDNTREPLMRRLRWFIFSCAGKPVTVEDLAENSGYSICYVRRIIKNELGLTIKQFIDRERLNIAINYLLHSELKSSNIADLMGFCNRQYFFRFFRKHTGKSPQEFLKKWDKSGKINDTFIWGN